jgi:hypothetical protein
MKRFPLLLPLVAVVFAVACTDATAPAISHALLSPSNPSLGALGNPPPPPVDAAIGVCAGTAGCTAYSGTYFSNGSSLASFAAATAIGDSNICDGTAWLRFDNTPGTASANARFKCQDDKKTFSGSLTIGGQLITIVSVDDFSAQEDCGTPAAPCANIGFSYRLGTGNTVFTDGHADAFHDAGPGCQIFFGEGGSTFYSCDVIG